ncbi:hydroxypyruvate isomerase family protein [Kibdelosporangium phytohabitans]|uniref:Hydroxypyruvate isomerase n=1 Tax=Kibdelosporangium phytohabitans TaxID=860235 RepID=A0A0N9IC63_9PSEU|nr:TIM barrel protein [Kibdelosporangium phytohabitans]ALG12518.1 hydroxypyruvate isomerase [Kibdelosporangium phytohabitans]MBE1464121.1 hydroxypyruvate isomerase [Kibdelosporangium phytohabitans]
MRLDANLGWLFTELPFEQRFDSAAAAGFTGVEYADPYPYTPAWLTKRLSDAGLKQVLINTPGTCMDANFRDGVDQSLEYAVELGSSFLHLVGGTVPDGVSPDRAFARYVGNVAWAADRATGCGVQLLLEAQSKPGFVLSSQEQAAAVAGEIGVGLLFDVFHAQVMETDLLGSLTESLPVTRHVQIGDSPGRGEPGTGDIPWPGVFAVLAGHDGWIGCEYQPVADTASGLKWIKELLP